MCSDNQNELTDLLRMTVPADCAERLELALEHLALSSSSWQPVDSDRIVYEAYFENSEDAARAANALTIQLMDCTGGMDGWSLTQETVPAEDWANTWKAFFHVERVSDRIVTKPSWEPYHEQPGDCVIELDPGMSFGTGQHETTRGCLRFIDLLTAQSNRSLSFLDLGCGSGILSIAAAKLGCQPLDAIDNDPDAVAIAKENIMHNGVADCIRVSTGDVAWLENMGRYDLVAANILAPVLIKHAASISATVENGGHLLLAGILTTQYPDVLHAYHALGFHEEEHVNDGEWTSGRLVKGHPKGKSERLFSD